MILFHLPGGVPIYAFSVLLALGATLGLAWVIIQAPEKERLARLDAGIFALLGSAVAGRAGYVLVNWAYFGGHPWQIPQIHLGGLSWPGALAGGLFFLWFFAMWERRPAAVLADALLPLALVVAIAAWLGCWLDGSAYGWPASAWWALPARDEWGLLEPRVPVQIVGALAGMALLGLSERLSRRDALPAGLHAALGLLGISASCFGLSFLRADVTLTWLGLRLEAWAGLVYCILALVGIVFLQLRRNKPERFY